MSRQRKKICVMAAVLLLALVIGAVLYTGGSKGGEKTPGGVFVSL